LNIIAKPSLITSKNSKPFDFQPNDMLVEEVLLILSEETGKRSLEFSMISRLDEGEN